MDNNENNNSQINNNEVENNVSEQPKSKKKNVIILVVGLVILAAIAAVCVGVFWGKSLDGTSETGNTSSSINGNTNTADNTSNNTSDDGSANIVDKDLEITKAKKIIAYFQPRASYMYGENMIESSISRLNYISNYLDSLGISQEAKSETNPSVSVELEVFKSTYFSIFGDNYIFDLKDFDSFTVSGASWVYICNEGRNLCWPKFAKENNEEKFSVTIDYNDSEIIRGTYSTTLGESGTFEIIYTEGKYLKSVVLTKTN